MLSVDLEGGSDAHSGLGDFRDALNRAGDGPDVRSGLSGLPARVQIRGLLRMPLHVAASVQHVGIGPRRPVRGQSIFCERGRARETTLSPASPRLLDMILRRLVWCHLVGLDHRTIL
jgi:hypothetical protein